MPRVRLRRPLALAFALGLCPLIACVTSTAPAPPPPMPQAPISASFQKLDGSVLTLGQLRGKVVLLTMMTTWADAALVEVPRFKRLVASHRPDQVVVIALVLEQSPKLALMFARTFDIPYYVVTVEDLAAFVGRSGPFGSIDTVPTSVLLDRDGRVAVRVDGPWPPDSLEQAVDRLVAGAGPSR